MSIEYETGEGDIMKLEKHDSLLSYSSGDVFISWCEFTSTQGCISLGSMNKISLFMCLFHRSFNDVCYFSESGKEFYCSNCCFSQCSLNKSANTGKSIYGTAIRAKGNSIAKMNTTTHSQCSASYVVDYDRYIVAIYATESTVSDCNCTHNTVPKGTGHLVNGTSMVVQRCIYDSGISDNIVFYPFNAKDSCQIRNLLFIRNQLIAILEEETTTVVYGINLKGDVHLYDSLFIFNNPQFPARSGKGGHVYVYSSYITGCTAESVQTNNVIYSGCQFEESSYENKGDFLFNIEGIGMCQQFLIEHETKRQHVYFGIIVLMQCLCR